MLNVIAKIYDQSMVMEFRISEVTEKYRTLQLYNQQVDQDKLDEAFSLEIKWAELVRDAKKKNFKLEDSKKKFREDTESDVKSFKADLAILYNE